MSAQLIEALRRRLDQAVMSKYATVAECYAARDALEDAIREAEALAAAEAQPAPSDWDEWKRAHDEWAAARTDVTWATISVWYAACQYMHSRAAEAQPAQPLTVESMREAGRIRFGCERGYDRCGWDEVVGGCVAAECPKGTGVSAAQPVAVPQDFDFLAHALSYIDGEDADGPIGVKAPFSWETDCRVAWDMIREHLAAAPAAPQPVTVPDRDYATRARRLAEQLEAGRQADVEQVVHALYGSAIEIEKLRAALTAPPVGGKA